MWLNKVGTFGIASSNYWFARLIGGPSRLVAMILGQTIIRHLLYSDDFKWMASVPDTIPELLLCLVLLDTLGVPLS